MIDFVIALGARGTIGCLITARIDDANRPPDVSKKPN